MPLAEPNFLDFSLDTFRQSRTSPKIGDPAADDFSGSFFLR
jgi:hypothetical protein